MEDVIKRIIYLEQKAQHVINAAEQEKLDKFSNLDNRIEALEKKIVQDAKDKIERVREMELSSAKKEAKAKYESCTGKLKMLEQYYKDEKNTWCTHLYAQVLKEAGKTSD